MSEVKHHGFIHLILILLLFLLSTFIFGGWEEGPLTSGLFLGLHVYAFLAKGFSGNIDAVNAMGRSVLSIATIFLVNLFIYYILSILLIFLFNLFRKRKDRAT